MVLSLGLVPVYVDICRRSRRHCNDNGKGNSPVFLRASTKRPVYGLKRASKRAQYRLLTCVASGKIWKEKYWNFKTTAAFVKHTYSSAKDSYFNAENLDGNPGIEGQVRLDGKDSRKPETQYIAIAATPRASWDSVNSSSAFATSRFALLLGVVMTICGAVSLIAILFGRWWSRLIEDKGPKDSWSGAANAFEAPSAFSFFLKKDIRRKETVEWVNMVLGKIWKVYRRGLETYFVDLLQPLIDNLDKPSYVRRVQIKQFYLGDEPLSVRSVERRTSRRANDLQYHIGLRYTGKAKLLLSITLVVGFVPVIIPVGVRGLDLDGEIWVKLRLIPSEPWVGTATWAFVSMPKIILALAPFGLFNIMAIPFISRFLTKLLTEDLPQLFVRPNKIVLNFLNNATMGPYAKQFREGLNMDNLDNNQDFAGELSVTLVDARKLSYFPVGKTDPYVVLTLGDQVVRSKKNSQTSIIGPPGAPIWNQDFQLLVVDPKTQKLTVRVRDTFGLGVFTVGYGEIDLSTLQDTVPTDKIVPLSGGWRPLPRRFAGELMVRLTYKAYVEEEEEEDESIPLSDADSDTEKQELPRRNYYRRKRTNNFVRDLFTTVVRETGYEATLVKPERQRDGHNGHNVQSGAGDPVQAKQFEVQSGGKPSEETSDKPASTVVEVQSAGKASEEMSGKPTSTVAAGKNTKETNDNPTSSAEAPPLAGTKDRKNKWRLENSAIIWLSLATGIALLAALSLNFSNLLSP